MTPSPFFMAIVRIVANRRAAGQLPGPAGLSRIRRILVPGYSSIACEEEQWLLPRSARTPLRDQEPHAAYPPSSVLC
jgi:hypothetical protein